MINALHFWEENMDYLTTSETAEIWNITRRRVNVLCCEGRIEGAIKKGKIWLIPDNAKKPVDSRVKQKGKIVSKNKK